MKINVRKLHKGAGHFDYNDEAEVAVANYVAIKKQMVVESFSRGFNPFYDAIMNSKKHEIKIQSGKMLCIEYARPDFSPSGISLTEAEYYIMVNMGWNSQQKCNTGKVRYISTNHLKAAMLKSLTNGNHKLYPANNEGPGSRVVYIDPKLDIPNDGWIGDVASYTDTKDGVVYDFDNIIVYGHQK